MLQAFADIKNYYNDITHNNLDLIKTLKEDVAEMKKKEAQNEKLMYEIAQENKRLSEPLQKVCRGGCRPCWTGGSPCWAWEQSVCGSLRTSGKPLENGGATMTQSPGEGSGPRSSCQSLHPPAMNTSWILSARGQVRRWQGLMGWHRWLHSLTYFDLNGQGLHAFCMEVATRGRSTSAERQAAWY